MALDSEAERAEEAIRGMASAANQANPAFESLLRSIMRLERATNKLSTAKDDELSAEQKQEQAKMNLRSAVLSAAHTLSTFAHSVNTIPSSVASSNQAFSAILPTLQTVSTGLQGLIGAASSAISSFTKFLGPVGGTIGKFIGGIGEATNAVIQFATAGIAQQINSTQQLVNNLNTLSASGLSFGANLDTAKRAAAEGGMSLERFASVASKNVENLVLLGKNAEQSAASAVKFGKTLGDLNPGLRTLYGGIEGLDDAVIDYMASQARLGIDQQRNQKELAEGAKGYLLNQKELSNLTGKSVDALKKEQEARAMSAAYQMRLGEMTLTQRQNTETALEQIRVKYGEQAYKYAVESVARGGDVISKTGLQYQSFLGENARAIDNILSSTNQSADGFKRTQAEIFQSAAPLIAAQNKSLRGLTELQAAGYGPDVLNMINESTAANIKSSNQQQNAIEAQVQATKNMTEINNAYAKQVDDLNVSLENLKIKLENTALENFKSTGEIVKMMYKFTEAMQEAANYLVKKAKEYLPGVPSEAEKPAPPPPPAPRVMPEVDAMGNPIGESYQPAAATRRQTTSAPAAANTPTTGSAPAPAAPERPQQSTTANVSSTPSTITVSSIDPAAVMTIRAEDLLNAINNLPTRADMDSHNREVIGLLTQIRNQG